jgi:hypothetical protein
MRQVDIRSIDTVFRLWHLDCGMTLEIELGFLPISEQYRMPFYEAIETAFGT